MTTCTPNESEVEQLFGIRIGENARVLERAGRELLRRTRSAAVLITRGSRGMALFEPDRPTVAHPDRRLGSDRRRHRSRRHGDRHDDAGAAAGATFPRGRQLANYAGGIVVMKRGTATVSADELGTRSLIATG